MSMLKNSGQIVTGSIVYLEMFQKKKYLFIYKVNMTKC